MVVRIDPCNDCPDKQEDRYGDQCNLICPKWSAWLNYQAGMRTVVEWIEKNGWVTELNIIKSISVLGWSLFLKEHFSPEQLKEWGMRIIEQPIEELAKELIPDELEKARAYLSSIGYELDYERVKEVVKAYLLIKSRQSGR